MSSIADLNDTPRRQSAKCSAHSRKRGTDVLADVRAVHRQIDFGRLLALGDLELFDELQEHRELSDGSFLAKQKSVPLGLPQFLTELANNVKFQLGVFGKTVASAVTGRRYALTAVMALVEFAYLPSSDSPRMSSASKNATICSLRSRASLYAVTTPVLMLKTAAAGSPSR